MNMWMRMAILTALVGNVAVGGCAKTATDKRAATPTVSERISRDAITGDVRDVGSNYVSIRQTNGETMRVRVNDRTKMDAITEGDYVKAYVTDDGYASTIQRVPR
jgi:Cu/Ag efflux protein CusF